MSTPTPETSKPWYKTRRGIAIIIGVIVVLWIIGTFASGGDESSTAADETTTSATVEETTAETTSEIPSETTSAEETTTETEAEEAETTTESAVAAGNEGQVMPWTRHERCEPDDGTAAMLTGVLNDQSLAIGNAQLIKDGEDTWIGASLLDTEGDLESRSDVWLLQDGALFSVSGGARNESWAVPHPDPAYSMANEFAQGVDRCVVAESTGR